MPKNDDLMDDYCPHCGAYTGGDSICPNCGTEIFNDSGLEEHDDEEGGEEGPEEDEGGGYKHSPCARDRT